jgi:hypothetical protein
VLSRPDLLRIVTISDNYRRNHTNYAPFVNINTKLQNGVSQGLYIIIKGCALQEQGFTQHAGEDYFKRASKPALIWRSATAT